MRIKNLVSVSLISLFIPLLLRALPQDQEVFLDFEDAEGSGDFLLGTPPNDVQFIGFTVETLEDPSLLHSGTKALTLGPGQEGKIFTRKGIAEIEFYVGETTGAGKIEVREITVNEVGIELIELTQQGIFAGFPTSINPDSNPPLQSIVAFSGNFFDETDLNYIDGMNEIKFVNVTGTLVIDDVGYTLIDGPRNNTVFTFFSEFPESNADITLGTSPITATFSGADLSEETSPPLNEQSRTKRANWRVMNGIPERSLSKHRPPECNFLPQLSRQQLAVAVNPMVILRYMILKII